MTPEQLDEIEKLAEAATPGPWSREVWQGNDDTGGWAAVGPHHESTDCICESEEDRTACAGESCADDRSQNDEEQAWKDAVFIRAMRQHALPLVKAVREARAEVERLRSLLVLKGWMEEKP